MRARPSWVILHDRQYLGVNYDMDHKNDGLPVLARQRLMIRLNHAREIMLENYTGNQICNPVGKYLADSLLSKAQRSSK